MGHKSMLSIAGHPLITHAVRQLYIGGIRKLFVIVAKSGASIIAELTEVPPPCTYAREPTEGPHSTAEV